MSTAPIELREGIMGFMTGVHIGRIISLLETF